jgi:hypothetical protein
MVFPLFGYSKKKKKKKKNFSVRPSTHSITTPYLSIQLRAGGLAKKVESCLASAKS